MSENLNRNQQFVLELTEALETNELLRVRKLLESLHPSEIADLLESLPGETRDELWVHIDPAIEGDVLAHSSTAVLPGLLDNLDPEELAAATESLGSDDVADILQELPEAVADEVLQSMDEQRRERVEVVLNYDADTAGGLMNIDVLTVRSDVDVEVVFRYLRLLNELPQHTDQLMVADRENRFLGVLPLSALVTAAPTAQVTDIMSVDEPPISAVTSVNDVAVLFEQRDLISAPVVDQENHLIGRITIDDVVDVIREESERTLLSAAGLDEEHDIFAPVWITARRRALWLAINLPTAFLAAWVIGRFEATIDQLVALAVLMPIVASMGGVAGSQTLTIVVRGLALGQVGAANARTVLIREAFVGVLNGALWALVVAFIAGAWFGSAALGFVIGSAMIVNLLTAGIAGAAIPLLFRRFSVDPALAGGVVLTTVTDVVGFFAFLALATHFLL